MRVSHCIISPQGTEASSGMMLHSERLIRSIRHFSMQSDVTHQTTQRQHQLFVWSCVRDRFRCGFPSFEENCNSPITTNLRFSVNIILLFLLYLPAAFQRRTDLISLLNACIMPRALCTVHRCCKPACGPKVETRKFRVPLRIHQVHVCPTDGAFRLRFKMSPSPGQMTP